MPYVLFGMHLNTIITKAAETALKQQVTANAMHLRMKETDSIDEFRGGSYVTTLQV